MSKQGVLSYRIEAEHSSSNLTGLVGLAPFLDLAVASGLLDSMQRNLNVCGKQGWSDHQIVMALVLLNVVGGDCVEDLDRLNADEGFGKLLSQCENRSLPRRLRRELKKRWRKSQTRNVASTNVARRYLSAFHDESQEDLRVTGKAFVPKASEHLLGLRKVNADFVEWAQQSSPSMIATLDIDATLIETMKSNALYCYKGFRAYQPFNVWWAEQVLMLHSEFRDGNVPAGYEQTRVVQEALLHLPKSVRVVRLRSDTAGYEHKLLQWLDNANNKRVGRIEFAVSCDVSREFRRAVEDVDKDDWHSLYKEVDGKQVKTRREWAEVCFVPDAIAPGKNGRVYRYLATREALANQPLPEMDASQLDLPFQTMKQSGIIYKIFGLATNMDWSGNDIIRFHDARSGKAEEAHKILKDDFAGGKMPSDDFGANAAWWAIAILAMNLVSAMKRVVLGGDWAGRRMKAIRFLIICVPGRVAQKARQLYLRLGRDHPALEMLIEMRRRICGMIHDPPVPA